MFSDSTGVHCCKILIIVGVNKVCMIILTSLMQITTKFLSLLKQRIDPDYCDVQ